MFILDRCNQFLKTHYAGASEPASWVLEAGGGSFSHFALPEGARMVALDISHGQLVRNTDVDMKVQGDLHHLPVAPGAIDMAVCFNVIEHLDDPEAALSQLISALRPGGVLILGCPNRDSLKGLVTRLTPVWFHRAYYRYVVGKQDRGEGHYDAFETPFRSVVSRRRLPEWLSAGGMEMLFFEAYDGAAAYGLTTGSWKTRLMAVPYYLTTGLARLLSLGRWRASESDLLLVARKGDGLSSN